MLLLNIIIILTHSIPYSKKNNIRGQNQIGKKNKEKKNRISSTRDADIGEIKK